MAGAAAQPLYQGGRGTDWRGARLVLVLPFSEGMDRYELTLEIV